MNSFPNSNGKYLDLVLSSEVTNVVVDQPEIHELIDNNSIHHYALSILVYARTSERELPPNARVVFNIKLNDTKTHLQSTQFDLNAFTNGSLILNENEEDMVVWIDTITSKLKQIQQDNSVQKMFVKPVDVSTHPWTNNTDYRNLFSRKVKAKKIFLANRTDANKQILRRRTIELYDKYNELKVEYYERLIIGTGDESRDLFTLMKSKKKSSASFPITKL